MEKKIIYIISIVLIVVTLLIVGCTQKTTPEQPSTGQPSATTSQQLTIKTGTSFGECVGYCKQDITITSEEIIFHKSGWGQEYPEITQEVPISDEQWNRLMDSVDFEKFNSLQDVIGCPDCADGGAEWIEINNGKSTKKVTFEYGDTISEIDDLILELRKIRNDVFSQFKD